MIFAIECIFGAWSSTFIIIIPATSPMNELELNENHFSDKKSGENVLFV
jgi:hypothetical protein